MITLCMQGQAQGQQQPQDQQQWQQSPMHDGQQVGLSALAFTSLQHLSRVCKPGASLCRHPSTIRRALRHSSTCQAMLRAASRPAVSLRRLSRRPFRGPGSQADGAGPNAPQQQQRMQGCFYRQADAFIVADNVCAPCAERIACSSGLMAHESSICEQDDKTRHCRPYQPSDMYPTGAGLSRVGKLTLRFCSLLAGSQGWQGGPRDSTWDREDRNSGQQRCLIIAGWAQCLGSLLPWNGWAPCNEARLHVNACSLRRAPESEALGSLSMSC